MLNFFAMYYEKYLSHIINMLSITKICFFCLFWYQLLNLKINWQDSLCEYNANDKVLRLRSPNLVFLQLQFEAFNTFNLLYAKWKVVPARDSGWKEGMPICITVCLEVFEFETFFFLCDNGLAWEYHPLVN